MGVVLTAVKCWIIVSLSSDRLSGHERRRPRARMASCPGTPSLRLSAGPHLQRKHPMLRAVKMAVEIPTARMLRVCITEEASA